MPTDALIATPCPRWCANPGCDGEAGPVTLPTWANRSTFISSSESRDPAHAYLWHSLLPSLVRGGGLLRLTLKEAHELAQILEGLWQEALKGPATTADEVSP